MERRVLTYKDVEEARKYIGKSGVVSDNLFDASKGIGPRGVLEELYLPSRNRTFKVGSYFQFFSPDPEPVERWVPFTADDWPLFVGKPIVRKGIHWFLMIQSFSFGEVDIRSNGTHSYQELVDQWTFMDGTPCGKRIME